MWPKGTRKKKEKRKKHYPDVLKFKHKRQIGGTTWKNWSHKPHHPLLTATAHHTQQNQEKLWQNTGKTMSKQDKGPRSKYQASALILNSIFKINSGIILAP